MSIWGNEILISSKKPKGVGDRSQLPISEIIDFEVLDQLNGKLRGEKNAE